MRVAQNGQESGSLGMAGAYLDLGRGDGLHAAAMLTTLLLTASLAAAPGPTICAPGAATAKLEEGRTTLRERAEGGAKDAAAQFVEAERLDPDCLSALWELGWALQLQGDHAGNVAVWERLAARRADYPELGEHLPSARARRDQLAALAKLPDPGKLPPVDEAPADGPRLTLAAVGDVTMGKSWPEDGKKLPPDPSVFFAGVADLLTRPDVTFGNLETVLADEGASTKCGRKSNNCYAFRIPTSYAAHLKAAGFDAMSIANNHAGDFGPSGRRATIKALDAAGILHSGPVGDVARWEVKGVKFGMIAFSFGSDVHRVQELETARRLVAKLASEVDVVVVSFHAGAEGKGADRVTRKTEIGFGEDRGNPFLFARTVVDAGADVVLGHGPHVFRAMEVYKGRFIAYSLGNFSSWQLFSLKGPGGISGILELELAKNGVATKATLHPTILQEPGVPVKDPARKVLPRVRELSKEDLGSELFDADGVWVRPAVK